MANGCGIMLVNSPGGSTLQLGVAWDLLCMALLASCMFNIITVRNTASVVTVTSCCSASIDLTISVSSHLQDEDLHQLQQTMKETLARLTRFVACLSLVLGSCLSLLCSRSHDFCRSMLAQTWPMPSCIVHLSVCPSVTFMYYVETNKHIFKNFFTVDILVFDTKCYCNILMGTP